MNTQTKDEAQAWLHSAISVELKAAQFEAQFENILSSRLRQRREKVRQQARTWLIEAVQVADQGEAFDQLFLATFPPRH